MGGLREAASRRLFFSYQQVTEIVTHYAYHIPPHFWAGRSCLSDAQILLDLVDDRS